MERLLSQQIEGLSANPDVPRQLLLTLRDLEGRATGEEGSDLARTTIEAFLNRLNALGRLRWGRVFEGVSITSVKSLDKEGRTTQHVFVGTAVGHMLPEDFADMVERLGHERPPLPKGIDVIDGLDFAASMKLSETKPEAMRAIHLVDLMLRGDDEIDWAAGYAALEIVEHDLISEGSNGKDLGWWTKNEIRDFKATANSPEVLGVSARHGKPSGLTKARMTTQEASWFVRRVVVQWLMTLQVET